MTGMDSTVSSALARYVLGIVAAMTAWIGSGSLAVAGQPLPWQMGFQAAASPVMEAINSFHTLLLVIITVITLFVLALLLICVFRFNRNANPTPSRTSHNTMIEIVWTVVPILILVVIAVPSFRLLYKEQTIPPADLTIKAIGYQWYWGFEYPDDGLEEFSAIMLEDEELGPDDPRLLAVDNEVVVPVDAVVRVVVTAADVIHNLALPAFGVKMDAVPGRLNETWFQATKTGIYYGQCSELCGVRHAFMPLAVRVVTQAQYDAWLELAIEDIDAANEQLAAMIEADGAAAAAVVGETRVADAAVSRPSN